MSLFVRNALFTIVVPGSAAVLVPRWILTRGGAAAEPRAWPAVALIAAGAILYLACVRVFAVVGRGTPLPWDAPRRFVAVGPYRWVRNPIYLAALLVVLGEAGLFLSVPLLLYAAALAVCFHLFVVAYEEPTLRRRFGEAYADYLRAVRRWIPWGPARSPRSRAGAPAQPASDGSSGERCS